MHGDLSKDATIWGVSILWLGRLGKISQFVAALTIIAEILGAERLRNFGKSLHVSFTVNTARKILRTAFEWYRASTRLSAANPKLLNLAITNRKHPHFMPFWLNTVITFFFAVIAIYTLYSHFSLESLAAIETSESVRIWSVLLAFMVKTIMAACVFFVLIGPVITFTMIAIVVLLGLLIDIILIEPLACLIDLTSRTRWMKIVSLLLLLSGFYFDLLAS